MDWTDGTDNTQNKKSVAIRQIPASHARGRRAAGRRSIRVPTKKGGS